MIHDHKWHKLLTNIKINNTKIISFINLLVLLVTFSTLLIKILPYHIILFWINQCLFVILYFYQFYSFLKYKIDSIWFGMFITNIFNLNI